MDAELNISQVPEILSPPKSIISGFWRRLFAFALDYLILGISLYIAGFLLFDFFSYLGQWGRLLGFSVGFIYFGILNSSVGKGQTIGKRIMDIEVVDKTGGHISLYRSFLRYTILGIPLFLKGNFILPTVAILGWFLGFITMGFFGAIIYLYIFNRKTRQSLHDLITGTYVIKHVSDKIFPTTDIWKGHLIVVGIWFLIVIALLSLSSMLSQKLGNGNILAILKDISSYDKVRPMNVSLMKNYNLNNHTQISCLNVTVISKEHPSDNQAIANKIVSIILEKYPEYMKENMIAVTISYGYDLGFASMWQNKNIKNSPLEWEKILRSNTKEEKSNKQ